NASAANGSAASGFLMISASVSGCLPTTGGKSSGDGRYAQTASIKACTPLFLKADPHNTGEKDISITALLMAVLISSAVIESGSSKNFSSYSSSYSATNSISFWRHSITTSCKLSGISI